MGKGGAKLPVPAEWQPAVEAARHHLAGRLGIPGQAIAVTRVADGVELDPTATAASPPELAVWLLAEATTYWYRVDLSRVPLRPVPVDGAEGRSTGAAGAPRERA